MDEPSNETEKPVKRPGSRFWRIAVATLLVLVTILLATVYILFEHYGEKIIRRYLQDKVLQASDSVYRAGFSKLHLNLLTGKVVIDSFELFPDTARYNFLKKNRKTSRALYSISFNTLTIDRVRYWQIYTGKRINFRQLNVLKPLINILAFPDTAINKTQRWHVFYEDIYPTVSALFSDFHIDSVKVDSGIFNGSFRQKSGKWSEGEYQFSAKLKDVSVNPFSYYNKERVFYSKEVDLVIHNFDYLFPDSLYLLKAHELGFSLTRSELYGKDISFIPRFQQQRIRNIAGRDFYRFDLPRFSVSGIDLYKVLTGKTVDLDSISVNNLKVRVYRYKKTPEKNPRFLTTGSVDMSGLWNIVGKEVKYINIRHIKLNNGSFSYFSSPYARSAELSIGKVDLSMEDFLIDSLSHRDADRLFYSGDIELAIHNFSLALSDGVHYVNASSAFLSTKKSKIEVQHCMIFPDRSDNDRDSAWRHNLVDIKVPELTFTGIDLKKVFNRRVFDFDTLVIHEPDFHYTKILPVSGNIGRFSRAVDFFEAENEGFVYNLLKSYLWTIKGSDIIIEHGYAGFTSGNQPESEPLIAAGFDLRMYRFLIDSVHGMNQRGYFYSDDFDLTLRSVSVNSTDHSRQFHADSIVVKTRDSLIEGNNLTIIRSTENVHDSRGSGKLFLRALVSLRKLHLTGLNHKKLFLEKQLKADKIILEHPEVNMNSYLRPSLSPAGLVADTSFSTGLINSFDVGSCLVRDGVFSYKSEADKIASYFSMKEIDFSVVNARVNLPGENTKGLIRFDSLRLSILPLRAVLADSAFLLEAGSLAVGSYPMNISLKGIKITPVSKTSGTNSRDRQFALSIPDFRIKGFYFDRAIFDNQWDIDSISVMNPSLDIGFPGNDNAGKPVSAINPDRIFDLPVFIKSMNIGRTDFRDGNLGLTFTNPKGAENFKVRGYNLNISKFHIDSASGKIPSAYPFNAEDISLSVPGSSWVLKDSLYTFSIGKLTFSTRSSDARIDGMKLLPNWGRSEFNNKAGKQETMMSLVVPEIRIENMDIRKLVSEQRFHAERLLIPEFSFEAWLDQRIPSLRGEAIPMPHEMARKISYPVSFDTVFIRNGIINYEEQEGTEPGKIFFDQADAVLTGISFPIRKKTSGNISVGDSVAYIDLKGSARLMGKGRITAEAGFWPEHPRDSFRIVASVGPMEINGINPMLNKLVPVSIRKGTLDSLVLRRLSANNIRASGEITVLYHNLQIKIHPTRSNLIHKIENQFLTESANLILPLKNPRDDGTVRYGIILHPRDSTRGFFNYIWKSTLSGVKSTAGIETSEQKQIRKTLRRK